ncbi:MAG: TRAP transporter small permease [Alphaproteobacteria bacterium]|nr:TRAP transporter small permease [Alphaproteobacteria bacterium]
MTAGRDEGAPPQRAAGGAFGRAYEALGHLGGLILAVMAGAVFLQVVLRFLGRTGIDGLEEVPRYLFVWLIMIGAASAMQRDEHTVLDYFLNRFSPRLRALVVVLTTGLGIALFLFLIEISFVLVPNAQLQTSAGLGLPLGYVFAAIPLGAALILLPMFRKLLGALKDLWPRRS